MPKRKAKRPGPKPASIRGIAQLTGFSNTTVSLVLNGRSSDFNITKETRDLILAKAKELNYQPNIHARNLRSGHSNILGLMVPTLHNRFFGELAETFEALARASGKLALIHVTRYDPAEEAAAIRFFLSQNAECVFVANPMAADEIATLFEGSHTRQVYIDATVEGQTTVSTDNFAAARELTRAIIESMAMDGRSGEICFFGGMPDHQVTGQRIRGFRAALEEAGLDFSEEQVIWSPFSIEACYESVRTYLKAHPAPGGMFVNSIIAMEGITRYLLEDYETCHSMHYGVFDILPYLSLLTDLKIFGVDQDSQKIMETAFDLYSTGEPPEGGISVHVPHRMVLAKKPAARPVDGKAAS